MHLIPYPKKIKEERETLNSKTICVVSDIEDRRLIKALSKLPLSDNGIPMKIVCTDIGGEGYRLKIEEDFINLEGDSAAGVFYGIQTLRQIYTHNEIPCLYIEDKPDMEYRGFYHDITRGKIPTVETLKKLVDELAYFKQNSLQLYVEHTFEFKEAEDIKEKTGYITAEEIKEIDEYCYENFIEFIPSIATCGHLYELLQQEKYAHLQELESFKPTQVFWLERMDHHTIDPLNPESFEFVKSLLNQYLPLFKTNKVNIGGDEPFDLTIGKHKDMDTARLYIDFMKKIIDYLQSEGKTVMMWADPLILENIEEAGEIPENVILLTWCYGPGVPEERVSALKDLKNPFFVCPGTSSWYRLSEKVSDSEINITEMAEYGNKYGATGLLNTNWGDYGHPCSMELSMFGLAIGAQKAWNESVKIKNEFKAAANHLIYKNQNAAEYLYELDRISKKAEFAIFVRYYSNLTFERQKEIELPNEDTLKKAQLECREFIDKLSNQKWENDEYRKEMLVAAEGVGVMTELFAKKQGYYIERLFNTEKWLCSYRSQWVKKNKEGELCEIEKMFRFMEKE